MGKVGAGEREHRVGGFGLLLPDQKVMFSEGLIQSVSPLPPG